MSEDLNKGQLITARYGEKNQPDNIIWNAQIEGLLSHRSVRSFSQQALPEYWFETLVAAAQSASTSSNLQQWSMVAVTDPALKAQVRKLSAGDKGLANKYIEEAPCDTSLDCRPVAKS